MFYRLYENIDWTHQLSESILFYHFRNFQDLSKAEKLQVLEQTTPIYIQLYITHNLCPDIQDLGLDDVVDLDQANSQHQVKSDQTHPEDDPVNPDLRQPTDDPIVPNHEGDKLSSNRLNLDQFNELTNVFRTTSDLRLYIRMMTSLVQSLRLSEAQPFSILSFVVLNRSSSTNDVTRTMFQRCSLKVTFCPLRTS